MESSRRYLLYDTLKIWISESFWDSVEIHWLSEYSTTEKNSLALYWLKSSEFSLNLRDTHWFKFGVHGWTEVYLKKLSKYYQLFLLTPYTGKNSLKQVHLFTVFARFPNQILPKLSLFTIPCVRSYSGKGLQNNKS